MKDTRYVKGSFIVVPNRASVLGVGGMAQALYMWLCHYANMDGLCFPSRSTLAENLHCSVRSVDEYLKELIDAGLVSKETRFVNNEQTTNNYYLTLYEGSAKSARGIAESAPLPVQNLPTELNPVLTQPTDTSEIVISPENEIPRKDKKDTSYLKVFELWGKYPANWRLNKTQIQAAKNLLAEQSVEDIADSIRYAAKHKSEPFCPDISTPYDLDSKWTKLEAFYEKRV